MTWTNSPKIEQGVRFYRQNSHLVGITNPAVMLQNEPASLTILSREETIQRDKDIAEHSSSVIYSKRYSDDQFEYRHVILPKPLTKWVPTNRLMSEDEWRSLGVTQSPGWVHYMIHQPEPHILLFKREKDYQNKYPAA